MKAEINESVELMASAIVALTKREVAVIDYVSDRRHYFICANGLVYSGRVSKKGTPTIREVGIKLVSGRAVVGLNKFKIRVKSLVLEAFGGVENPTTETIRRYKCVDGNKLNNDINNLKVDEYIHSDKISFEAKLFAAKYKNNNHSLAWSDAVANYVLTSDPKYLLDTVLAIHKELSPLMAKVYNSRYPCHVVPDDLIYDNILDRTVRHFNNLRSGALPIDKIFAIKDHIRESLVKSICHSRIGAAQINGGHFISIDEEFEDNEL